MNKKLLLTSRILVTILIAGLLSAVLAAIVMFIAANMGMSNTDAFGLGNAVSYTVFGLAVGYRLNDLVRQYKA